MEGRTELRKQRSEHEQEEEKDAKVKKVEG